MHFSGIIAFKLCTPCSKSNKLNIEKVYHKIVFNIQIFQIFQKYALHIYNDNSALLENEEFGIIFSFLQFLYNEYLKKMYHDMFCLCSPNQSYTGEDIQNYRILLSVNKRI